MLASRLAETVDTLHSNVARVFVALFFAALISASEVRSQEYTETLLSTDNAYNPVPSPDGSTSLTSARDGERKCLSHSDDPALFLM